MNLSYTMRLLCLLIVVAGIVLGAAQLGLAMSARLILRRIEALPAVRREQVLYLLQIGPALFAAFVSIALCLPAFLRYEPHVAMESVSPVCLLAAAALLGWFAVAVGRGLRATLRTLRFAGACLRSGCMLDERGPVPVLVVPDFAHPVALIGFLHPRIIVSADFARASRELDPGALAIALAHEYAHVAHRDNWKLLSLSFLPTCGRLLPGGNPWLPLWQLATDWAADDAAVGADRARALLLAETLVRAAACSPHRSRTPGLSTGLTGVETGLPARVDRLILDRSGIVPEAPAALPRLTVAALLALGAALLASLWIYPLSEWLLHLGTL